MAFAAQRISVPSPWQRGWRRLSACLVADPRAMSGLQVVVRLCGVVHGTHRVVVPENSIIVCRCSRAAPPISMSGGTVMLPCLTHALHASHLGARDPPTTLTRARQRPLSLTMFSICALWD